MIDIFYRLSRWLQSLNIEPRGVKVTITFNDESEGWHAASDIVSKLNPSGLTAPTTPDMLTREFELFNIKAQLVLPVRRYMPACNCPFCIAMRDEAKHMFP